ASGIEARTPASLDFFSGRAAAVGDSHFLALRKWPTTGRRNIARRCASAASWNGAESTARGAERADGGGCAKASIAEALAGSLTRQGTRSSATMRRRNLFAIFRSLKPTGYADLLSPDFHAAARRLRALFTSF